MIVLPNSHWQTRLQNYNFLITVIIENFNLPDGTEVACGVTLILKRLIQVE